MRGGTCVRHPQCKQLIFNYLNLIRKALRTAREMGTEFSLKRHVFTSNNLVVSSIPCASALFHEAGTHRGQNASQHQRSRMLWSWGGYITLG